MLLIKTYLDKSKIHGIGVFAAETIRKDTKIWRFVYGFDRFYSRKAVKKLPKPAQEYLKLHGYEWENEILLSMDNDTFMNHSDDANTYYRNGYVLARRTIRKGQEITNDYRAFADSFCAAFLKEPKAAHKANGHKTNGHRANGHRGNGHAANGHASHARKPARKSGHR